MMDRQSDAKPKKAYEKPVVLKVPLRPDEAVLGNCKTIGASGPMHSSCAQLMCVTMGS